MSENLDVDYKKYVYCLANTNIPFNFEKGVTPQYNNIETNLKWSPDNQQRIRLYIENLLYMIRNKVLLNGGSLKQTKIVWFYPASMSYAQWEKFKLIWEEAYSKYFSKEDIENNLIATSESIAPYKYYNDTLAAKSNVVTIDIGGGTTDVYVVEDSDPKMLLSFKFASNSIFGDGYNWNSDNNGFVNTFKNEILETLKANRFIELEHTLKEIANRKNSNDINALFFSLNKSKDIKDNILSLDYLNMLSNDDYLKYVFIFFYSSILYYVAKCMKAKGLEMPLTIAFSGNGSKSLQILSNNNKTQVKFMKMIFEKVYNEKYQETNDLEIIYEANPKEATCKGGVIKPKADDPDVCENIKCALLGVDMDTTFVSRQDMDTIDNTMLESVVNEIGRASCRERVLRLV